MNRARMLLLAVVIGVVGCASGSGASGGERPARQSNELTQQEILDSQLYSLYDAVAMLRPTWLRPRGQISIRNPSAGQVVVYVDNVQAGGAEYLRQISVRDVESLMYYDASEATARFGIRQNGGAAIVILIADGD